MRSKAEIRKQIDNLVDYCVKKDLYKAYITVDKLDTAIVKYFISRNLEYDKIREILSHIKWTLTHFPNHEIKNKKFFEQLKDLYIALESADSKQSTKDKIIRIYTDLKEDFSLLCMSGSPDDMLALNDDFISFQKLSKEISDHDLKLYNRYITMMKAIGQCQAILPRLTPQQSAKGKWTVRVDAVNSLTNNFSQLYPLIENLIAYFDEPSDLLEQ